MKKQILLVVSILLLGFSIVSAQIPKTISGGVLNGKAQNLPAPEFPAAAKAVNASGTVNVQVTIDEDGNVTSANAVSGHPLLRSAAVDAARQAKFTPTQLSGQAVKVTGVIIYNFKSSAPPVESVGAAETGSERLISGGVVNGKAKNLAIPAYPAAAKAVGAEGAVNVQVTIDENGDVVSANSVSGHPLLRQAATTAAFASKFNPTLLNGQAVRVTGIIVYNFTAGDSTTEETNWLKIGYDLGSVQHAPTLIFLNTNSIGKFFQPDWTTENEQLQKLAEIKQAENTDVFQPTVIGERTINENIEKRDGITVKTVVKQRAIKSDHQPTGEQIAISQSLIASLQSRLGNDQLKLWQFNTGSSLSQALSKLRYTNERQRVLNALRQQIQTAPNGISPEYIADLQAITELLYKQNSTEEDRQQVGQILRKLLRNQ